MEEEAVCVAQAFVPRNFCLALHAPPAAFFHLSYPPISPPLTLFFLLLLLLHFWLQPHQWPLITTRRKQGIPIPTFSRSLRHSAKRSTKPTPPPLLEEQPRLFFLGPLFLLFPLLKMWGPSTQSTSPGPGVCLSPHGVPAPSSMTIITPNPNQTRFLLISRS